jgi:hypothetical protein
LPCGNPLIGDGSFHPLRIASSESDVLDAIHSPFSSFDTAPFEPPNPLLEPEPE